MLPKAIFFDLDDTIISFSGKTDGLWKKVCSSFVKTEKTTFNAEELLVTIIKTRNWFWSDPERHKAGRMDMIKARRDIVAIALKELQYYDEKKANFIADNFSVLQEKSIALFPDSVETLKKITDKGIRTALITNGTSESQRGKINRFSLSRYFKHCFIEGEVGIGKPDIRIYEIALEKTNLKPDEVWMIGDNLTWDVEAPQKVGIYSIWNDFRKMGLPKDSTVIPDRIVHSISELIK